jgi:endonuclease YncB( thermonuclease family)
VRNACIYWLFFILLFPQRGEAANLVGVASVIDGDTLEIHGQRIRLHGVDAPESPQYCYLPGQKKWRCGQAAAMALDDFIGGKTVTCEQKGKDRYRRIVAVCSAAGQDINAWLVENGWALAYERYSKAYVEHQKRAKTAQAGIWKSRFQKPWEWRKQKRKKAHPDTVEDALEKIWRAIPNGF